MLGRSDGVLNPGGIRFGPTDIYSVLETSEFAASIDDALVVGQMIDGGADERVLLFVKVGVPAKRLTSASQWNNT
jgi:acetoacetyl-CoA synthetase